MGGGPECLTAEDVRIWLMAAALVTVYWNWTGEPSGTEAVAMVQNG